MQLIDLFELVNQCRQPRHHGSVSGSANVDPLAREHLTVWLDGKYVMVHYLLGGIFQKLIMTYLVQSIQVPIQTNVHVGINPGMLRDSLLNNRETRKHIGPSCYY
jgi:hypothetical protein